MHSTCYNGTISFCDFAGHTKKKIPPLVVLIVLMCIKKVSTPREEKQEERREEGTVAIELVYIHTPQSSMRVHC